MSTPTMPPDTMRASSSAGCSSSAPSNGPHKVPRPPMMQITAMTTLRLAPNTMSGLMYITNWA